MKIFLFIILGLLISCSSSKLEVSKSLNNSSQPEHINYVNFWTAMMCGLPETANKYTNNNEELEFADALNDVLLGDFKIADKKFSELIQSSDNDTILYFSRMILEQSLIYQSKWEEYFEKFRNKESLDSKEKNRLLYPAFIGNKEHIVFGQKIDTIPFEIKNNLIIIQLLLDGKEFEFLFDTGSQLTVLSDELATHLNLVNLSHPKGGIVSSNSLYSEISTSIIKELKFGNIIFQNKPCVITNVENLKFKFLFYTFFSVDGILGWDIIKNLDVTIDYKTKKLYVKQPKPTQNITRNLFWLDHPIIKLKSSSGIDLLFFFDSGAQESRFHNFLLTKLKPTDLQKKSETIYGVGGKVENDIKVIPNVSFQLGDYQLDFTNIKSSIGSDKSFIKLDGTLGNDIGLESGYLHIDAQNGIFEIHK